MVLETIAIKTAFGAAWDFLKQVPREIWYALAAAAFLWWFAGAQYERGYDKRDAEYAEAARKAAEQARVADGKAREAADTTRTTVEEGNEDARTAADGSDDPLRDGLNSLRN